MNLFQTAFNQINKQLYLPLGYLAHTLKEEKQNQKYGGGTFFLEEQSIRFRVAKITPTKEGQFVAIWEKNDTHTNQAFSYEDSPSLLVINTFDKEKIGQFVFPKDILLKKGIYRLNGKQGKMGMRVYPEWSKPTSKQGIATQKWLTPYFLDLASYTPEKVKKMYHLS